MPNIETEINVDVIRKIEKFDNRTIGNLLSFGNSSEHIIRSAQYCFLWIIYYKQLSIISSLIYTVPLGIDIVVFFLLDTETCRS